MNKVIDNVVLLLLGTGMLVLNRNLTSSVLALLIGVIVASMGLYMTEQKKIALLSATVTLLSLLLPELVAFLPILFYIGISGRLKWMAATIWPVLLWMVQGEFETSEWMIWLVLSGLSVLLSYRTSKIESLQNQMIRMRDTSTELNMALREKNKDLREKQDYEIYLATLRERNRIAREIHDNVGHMLSRSILQIGALSTIHKEEPLHEQLGSINDTLNQAMNSIRESVHDLHDDSIDLRQAIAEATQAMQENYTVRIDYDMSKAVPRNVKYCFISTVKEAMSNVVKHSDADKIEIVLREHPGFYQLFIGDNGTVKKAKTQSNGIGLSNMRERVEALGGTININQENGFKIMINVRRNTDA